MSPQGGRQAPGKGGGGSASGRVAARRLGLLIFGASFLILFVVVAIAEGLGDPSIPSGNVAVIEEAPDDLGEITKAEFDRALEQAAASASVKKVPKPGDPQYDELKEAALDGRFESVWIQGLANEWGLEVTDQEIAKERKKLKKESFQSEAEYQKFLKDAKYNRADIDERVKLQILSTKIQEQFKEEIPEPSQTAIEAYYEEEKATQFKQAETRDIRIIRTKEPKEAEAAFKSLSKDNTVQNWRKNDAKYAETPNPDNKGDLVQEEVTGGLFDTELDNAIFSAPEGQVEGPVKSGQGFNVFEVVKINPASIQELKAVESQIDTTLKQQAEQENVAAFVTDFNLEWGARTFCAADYLTKRCANFKGDGHPTAAPPACYESDPDGGLPEACPAPVFQLIPALPGSVTPVKPQGEPLAQRPLPVAGTEEAAGGATGLPEGAVPPPSE